MNVGRNTRADPSVEEKLELANSSHEELFEIVLGQRKELANLAERNEKFAEESREGERERVEREMMLESAKSRIDELMQREART